MSALGYARWKDYRENGIWPKRVETGGAAVDGLGDPGIVSVLEALARLIKRNPVASEYVIVWDVDRWGSEWHDQYTAQQIYRRYEGKLLYVAHGVLQTHATLSLNDVLLFQLLDKWNRFSKNERDYNKVYKKWFEWWDAQK